MNGFRGDFRSRVLLKLSGRLPGPLKQNGSTEKFSGRFEIGERVEVWFERGLAGYTEKSLRKPSR